MLQESMVTSVSFSSVLTKTLAPHLGLYRSRDSTAEECKGGDGSSGE